MLTYSYVARDPSNGQKVHSTVSADTEQAAAKLVRAEGLVPIKITLGKNTGMGVLDKYINRVRAKDKVLFSRQLSTLINAGLPLVQSLRNVADQTTSKRLRMVVNQVIGDVEGGMALSAALAKHPEAFNQVYVALVEAGEASGTLDVALERLAIQQEKDADLISKVRGAMIYPIIVLLVMVGVVGFMLVQVLPQVKTLYEGLPGANLPLVTRILLGISDFVIAYWWVFLGLLALGIFFGSRWARTLGGKRFVDKAKLKVPPLNGLFVKMYMARFARTGTTLVASGVPLLQMLNITASAVNNVHISDAIHRAGDKVKGGKALSDSLQKETLFLTLVPNMIRIGEESGSLEGMLAKTADYYEKEVDNQVKAISTIIEPILMVLLGIVAFTIVAAVLLPIYGLAGQSFV